MSGEEQRLGIHGPHDHHHLMNTPRMCCFPQRQCFWLKLVFRGSAYFNKVVLRHYTVFNRYLAWFFGRPCKHILGHHTPPHQLRCEIIESNLYIIIIIVKGFYGGLVSRLAERTASMHLRRKNHISGIHCSCPLQSICHTRSLKTLKDFTPVCYRQGA